MPANLRRVLMAVALIAPTPSAFADVITDWNEKAVAFVTPRMAPPATQRAVAIVQVAMFDMAAYLATIPNSEAKSEGIKLGEAVAVRVLQPRAKDGSDDPDAYRPKTKPGVRALSRFCWHCG